MKSPISRIWCSLPKRFRFAGRRVAAIVLFFLLRRARCSFNYPEIMNFLKLRKSPARNNHTSPLNITNCDFATLRTHHSGERSPRSQRAALRRHRSSGSTTITEHRREHEYSWIEFLLITFECRTRCFAALQTLNFSFCTLVVGWERGANLFDMNLFEFIRRPSVLRRCETLRPLWSILGEIIDFIRAPARGSWWS